MLTCKHRNNYFRTRNVISSLIIAFALGASASDQVPLQQPTSPAADPITAGIREVLQARYPNTKFGEIQRTPMPGVWEVWMGSNVAYVTEDTRYFIFGSIFDMQTQMDLTAAKRQQAAATQAAARPKLTFSDLPLDRAIKTIHGDGSRKVAVFSDPDCPHCRKLDASLSRLKNATIYTFLYPVAALHPDSPGNSEQIWCAKDPSLALNRYMATGKLPGKVQSCPNPIEANISLAEQAGVNGTPFLFFANGQKAAGSMDVASLERYLAEK